MADNLTLYTRRPSARGKRSYTVRSFYWAFLVFLALAIISWASGNLRDSAPSSSLHVKRAHDVLQGFNEPECRLVRNAKDQCSFVRANCPDLEDGLLSYIQLYYCTLADAKPLAFIILILWLSLLFSTIGIAASDFLCIDLSTLASILGMSESLTGVTFLAFGNGSPDVFSTFAAMRSNSGSLAIGELLGAASFITSVVAGSMALVQPFKVARRSFVRDVGYFVIAVSFSMVLLADGRLHVWESAAMVGLYCFYVVLVVTWHWYLVRRRRAYERNLAARCHFHIPDNQELDIEEEVEDDDPGVASESRSLLRGASTEDFETLQRSDLPAWKDGNEDDETRNRYLAEIRENMHVFRPSARRRNTLNPIRPSLVGALEFQTVLSSLQKSRNIHPDMPISLDRYFDDPRHGRAASLQHDNMSVASHPRTNRPSGSSRFLSPNSASGSSRVRAVSANDAASLRLNTNVFESRSPQPLLTVSRPSVDDETVAPRVPQSDQTSVTLKLPSLNEPPRSPSPGSTSRSPSPNLLAPPGTFHSPNYQAASPLSRSTLDVSPMGTSYAARGAEGALESPSSPFPPFLNALSASSSRAPSIRLPAVSNPAERLHIHDDGLDDGSHQSSSPAKWTRVSSHFILQSIFPALFPTLVGWKSKTFLERLLGIIAAPSVLLLTLTLPVVDPVQPEEDLAPIVLTPADGEESVPAPRLRLPEDSPLIRTLEHEYFADHQSDPTGAKTHTGQGRQRWDSELPAIQPLSDPSAAQTKDWCQWLVWVQLLVGPFFVALIAWTTLDPELKARSLLIPALCSLLFSLLCIAGLTISTRHERFSQSSAFWRPFLALLGFVVAIFWIATIATEVVSLLKTVGVILNISDSLLGLTVFAVGNSLGDLVADITVARLGYPVMALSACFGGPMLNILLGIGLGGLYMTLNATPDTIATRTGSYEIALSKALIISGATLLATLLLLLIIIPLNNWRMDRKIGWGLIVLWVISTVGNVIAELST
ncbi:sodium/calcium exchanger protein [Aspergillus clavatus NRRL 1]|uniref:Sodium/calcium exchanger protein n=1 Tax=Aspergillus clavatus (strain ATCC 1007 / CBS 513.65 / DSM 816 / NCTC 3887 / NRRL 1 / QM 1276 / 107) TaxID=344612 RepID=A1CD75_ASPCL|nr:sodium/calcium exchanger protein [Aspergillus clavatus NRRL 1]EAW11802.1 sodium/calcium exchanger protein [Aspergillus clavatus NRRL 1]